MRKVIEFSDIFNYNNNFGCFDSLQIERAKFKRDNYKHLISRGVKNHYKKNFITLQELGISIDTSKMNMHKSITPDKVKLFKKACERQKINTENLIKCIDKFNNISLLVIGDTIVDQYIAL